jgi:hypothetical protein
MKTPQRRSNQADVQTLKGREQGRTGGGGGGWSQYFARGVVTDVLGGGVAYTVAKLNDDGTQSAVTFSPCFTHPSGGLLAVEAVVTLWFERQGQSPWILDTSVGDSGLFGGNLIGGYIRFFTS